MRPLGSTLIQPGPNQECIVNLSPEFLWGDHYRIANSNSAVILYRLARSRLAAGIFLISLLKLGYSLTISPLSYHLMPSTKSFRCRSGCERYKMWAGASSFFTALPRSLSSTQMGSYLYILRGLLFGLLVSTATANNACQKPKVRREWRKLSPSERTEWINAVNVFIPCHEPCMMLTSGI